MDRFKLQEELGDGTFGTVFRAIRREDNSEVSDCVVSLHFYLLFLPCLCEYTRLSFMRCLL